MTESHRTGKTGAAWGPRAETMPAVASSGTVAFDPFAPGCIVAGKYLVESVLGEGGIGVVVRAKHIQLDQTCALKHLKPAAASRPDVVERFVREARLAAKIKNEHA